MWRYGFRDIVSILKDGTEENMQTGMETGAILEDYLLFLRCI